MFDIFSQLINHTGSGSDNTFLNSRCLDKRGYRMHLYISKLWIIITINYNYLSVHGHFHPFTCVCNIPEKKNHCNANSTTLTMTLKMKLTRRQS